MPSQFIEFGIPTQCVNHTLHDTNTLSGLTIAFTVVVTTAGVIVCQMWGDSAAVNMDVGIGTHYIPGNWKYIKSTGTTAVITNTRATVWINNPSELKY